MGIYPDKDRYGKLTGKYRVEVQLRGLRHRGKFNTLEQAQAHEAQWKLELTQMPLEAPTLPPRSHDKRDVPKSLGQLYDKAKASLWRGKATEVQSLQRCMYTVATIGTSRLLSSLVPQDIDGLISDLLSDQMAPATVNRYLSALHSLLAWGVERKYLQSTPKFTWQTEEEGRIRWLSENEEAQLYNLLPTPVADVVKVAIATGMRRNELLGLDSSTVEPGWVRLWKTKSKTPRSVPITGETYSILQRLIQDGMPTQHQLRYGWDTAKEAMGLKDDPLFVFHATRHTCATRLVRANVNIRVIQKWLGHKRIETTLRYAHVNDEMLSSALVAATTAVSRQDVDKVLDMRLVPTVDAAGHKWVDGRVPLLPQVTEVKHSGRGEIGRHAGFRFPPDKP